MFTVSEFYTTVLNFIIKVVSSAIIDNYTYDYDYVYISYVYLFDILLYHFMITYCTP